MSNESGKKPITDRIKDVAIAITDKVEDFMIGGDLEDKVTTPVKSEKQDLRYRAKADMIAGFQTAMKHFSVLAGALLVAIGFFGKAFPALLTSRWLAVGTILVLFSLGCSLYALFILPVDYRRIAISKRTFGSMLLGMTLFLCGFLMIIGSVYFYSAKWPLKFDTQKELPSVEQGAPKG